MSTDISIIIPSYNSEKTIIKTLEALENQTNGDFEVIVVDDGSVDASPELIRQFSQHSRLPLKLIRQQNAGPATARNEGAQQAQGEKLLFLDSDCLPAPNWVEEMARPLGAGIAGCYSGNRVRNPESMAARYVEYEMARRHEGMRGKDIDAISTYSASFLKSVFLKCGGFNTQYREASGEDFDLTFNIARAGYRLRFIDSTYVYQYHPSSWREYFRKQFKRGYWRVKLYLRNRDKIVKGDSYTGLEPQAQFALSLVALVSLPLAALYPFSPAIGLGMLLLSNLPFGVWAFKRERKFLLVAPAAASLRSLAGTLGSFKYIIDRGFK